MRTDAVIERQVTQGPGGRILTNTGVWSPDSEWIVYDTRSDAAGELFDGRRIEIVRVETGEVRVLHEATNGAHCGVATFHPRESMVVFILGPENPTPDWTYNAWHRQGVIVDALNPGRHRNLDARDIERVDRCLRQRAVAQVSDNLLWVGLGNNRVDGSRHAAREECLRDRNGQVAARACNDRGHQRRGCGIACHCSNECRVGLARFRGDGDVLIDDSEQDIGHARGHSARIEDGRHCQRRDGR